MTEHESNIHVSFSGMAYGGDAVGRDPEGRAVFAWPAIEGETAEVRITESHPNFLKAVVLSVDESSPQRVLPSCPYFGVCGGCQWQHISYGSQLRFKAEILASQLSRTGGVLDPAGIMRPPFASPHEFGYRNSSHFAVEPTSGKLAYFQRDSHSLVAVETCPISNTGINTAIPVVNSLIASARVPVGFEDTRGLMRLWKVTIRSSEATGQTVIVFHSRLAEGRGKFSGGRHRREKRQPRPQERPDAGPGAESNIAASPYIILQRREVRRALAGLAKEQVDMQPLLLIEVMEDGTINSLGESHNAAAGGSEAHADAVTGSLLRREERGQEPTDRLPLGAWVEQLGGRHYWVPPQAFFQVNTAGAELMLAEVRENLPAGLGLLLDAHAGVGTFALAFASQAKSVIGFEVDAGAVAGARWSARAHRVSNVDFRVGKAETLVTRLSTNEQPDVALLDPPRSGCHLTLLQEIMRHKVPSIIYVSCDPSTMARDVKILQGAYKLKSARLIDMFPQTYHIETVAVLDFIG